MKKYKDKEKEADFQRFSKAFTGAMNAIHDAYEDAPSPEHFSNVIHMMTAIVTKQLAGGGLQPADISAWIVACHYGSVRDHGTAMHLEALDAVNKAYIATAELDHAAMEKDGS